MKIKPTQIHVHSLILLMLTGFIINVWWGLREVATYAESSPLSGNLEVLSQQQEVLRSDLDALVGRDFIDVAQYRTDQESLARKLVQIAKPKADEATLLSLKTDLLALHANVEAMQKELAEVRRMADLRPQSVVKPATLLTVRKKPRKLSVPFALIGLEYRGGESFLAVSPLQNAQLQNVQLLRPGDSQEGWRLETLTSENAHFILPDGRRHVAKLAQGANP
jgi:hypothetical protein